MVIKNTNYSTEFEHLKAGDIFSFANAPSGYFIKTDKGYSVGGECENCDADFSFDLGNYCVNLETGKFYAADRWEKVIVYKNTELTLNSSV